MTVVSVEHALAGKLPEGGEVTVRGWVRTLRGSAGLAFINVTDGSCFAPIQVVANDTLPNFDEIKRLTSGCSLIAKGVLVKSQGKGQSFEIQASGVDVVGWVEDPLTYPIQPKPMTPEFLREVAHLRPRTNLFGAVTRIRNCLAQAIAHTPLTQSRRDAAGARCDRSAAPPRRRQARPHRQRSGSSRAPGEPRRWLHGPTG